MASLVKPACSAIGRSTWILRLCGLDSCLWLKMTVGVLIGAATFEGRASLSGIQDSPERWRCVSRCSTAPYAGGYLVVGSFGRLVVGALRFAQRHPTRAVEVCRVSLSRRRSAPAVDLQMHPLERAVAFEFGPVPGEGLAGFGVLELGRQVGQRLEDVGVLENLAAGQHQLAEAAGAFAEQENVDVQGPVCELGQIALAAVLVFELGQPGLECFGLHFALDPAAGVEEVLAVESNGFGLVGRRAFDLAETIAQRRNAGGELVARVDIAAQSEIDLFGLRHVALPLVAAGRARPVGTSKVFGRARSSRRPTSIR